MESDIQIKFRRIARIYAYIVVAICILVSAGWQFDLELLKRPIAQLASMNPTTAFGCTLSALGVLILNKGKYNFPWRIILNSMAFLTILIGILRLLSFFRGLDVEVDSWLYNAKIAVDAESGTIYHMAPTSAICFILLGLSLLCSQQKGRWHVILANYTALLPILIGMFIILGYAYAVSDFYNVLSFLPMSIHSAFCIVLLGSAILFSNCNASFITILMSKNQGGRVARYMIPLIFMIPIPLGYLRLWLFWRGPFSVEFGVALLITVIIIIFYSVTQYLSIKLDKVDLRKIEAEQKLVDYYKQLELNNIELKKNRELQAKIIGEVEEYAVIMLDSFGRIEQWNKGAAKIKGYNKDEIIGKHFSVFYTKEDREMGLPEKHLKLAVEEGKVIREGWRVKNDGSLFWASVAITPLYDGEGNIFGFSKFTRDFTKIKNLEEQLRELNLQLEKKVEERTKEVSDYKYALDESSIVAITDQRGTIQYVNDNFCNISKYNRHELIGQDHRIINSGYHSASFIKDLWVTIANGKIWRGEIKNKAKDGSYYWVDTTIVPFLNETGKPYQYIAIRSDITRRKEGEVVRQRLEEEVNFANRELAGVFEKISDGFIMLDNNFCYTYANKRVGEMVNRSPETLIGKCVWDEFPDAVNSSTYNAFERAMKEQRYIYNVDYYEPLDLWQENHIYPSTGKLSIFIRDISEQKRAQEKIAKSERIYKTIASGIPGSIICLFDTDYRYLLIEGDMLEKLGFSKEILIENKASEVLPPDRFANMLPDLERVFKGEGFTKQINRDGYDMVVRYVPLIDDKKHVYAAMTVGIDVTELQNAYRKISDLNRNLEQKVIERTDQLQLVNKELEAFSYSVSHDLRAPLRAVNGYAKMLEEDYTPILDEEGKRLLAVIQSNASRMGYLIDDLLAFSRLGRKELNKTVVNMNDLVNDVILDIQNASPFTAQIEVKNLHSVFVDHKLMFQVIINLVGNAIKYSSKNPDALVQLSSDEKDDSYEFSVKDNGVGFDMRYVHKIFGVFQRLHSSEEFEGTGVGLAIVEKIISKHGGKIWAESEIDKGATFYFRLPK
jgi:PAS domain S-box-containing protein